MRILVTGANGQLGNEMRELAKENPQHTSAHTSTNCIFVTNRRCGHALPTIR